MRKPMDHSAFVIGPVRREDLPDVGVIEREAFGAGGYSGVILRQFFELSCGAMLLARSESAGETLGYIVGSMVSDRARPDGWLLAVAVGSHARGRGVGSALTMALFETLARHGCERVYATVSPGNAASRAMLGGCGFVEQNIEADYFGPGADRLLIARDLTRDEGGRTPAPAS